MRKEASAELDSVMQVICENPFKGVFVKVPPNSSPLRPPFDWRSLVVRLGENPRSFLYRSVGLDRLHAVVRSGIDASPTDAVFYATQYFDKAWEYNEIPKVILGLDPETLERSFRRVPRETPPQEIAALRETYPTLLEMKDQRGYWLSRLPVDSRRVATQYEAEYGWWAPCNPLDALRVVLLVDESDESLQLFLRLTRELPLPQ